MGNGGADEMICKDNANTEAKSGDAREPAPRGTGASGDGAACADGGADGVRVRLREDTWA